MSEIYEFDMDAEMDSGFEIMLGDEHVTLRPQDIFWPPKVFPVRHAIDL